MFQELYKAVNNFYINCLKNEMVEARLRDEITQLFTTEYYDYHYLSNFFDDRKIHFLAFSNDAIVGYASIVVNERLAYFSNLLVSKKYRNLFIGSKLEAYRINYCNENNLVSYSSCVMDSIHSQILKFTNNMIPINLKFGYRSDVLHKGHLGGAVTFLNKNAKIFPVNLNSLVVDDKTKRIRLITSDIDTVYNFLRQIHDKDDWYIDLISSAAEVLSYANSSNRFAHQGHDICNEKMEGGMLFQVKNDRYWQGASTKNRILFSSSDICSFIKLSKIRESQF